MSNRRKIKPHGPVAPSAATRAFGRFNGYMCGGGATGAAFRAANPSAADESFCGRTLITEDIHEGVTPMFLGCPFCGGRMVSMGYPSGPPPREPDIEWRADHGPNECMAPYWRGTPVVAELGKTPGTPMFPRRPTR